MCHKKLTLSCQKKVSGVRGGLCNPSYWKDRSWGWPEDRKPVWGQKQPSEGPHYTWEQGHYCSQEKGGPGSSGGRPTSNLPSSAQSVVFNNSCSYHGVRIELALELGMFVLTQDEVLDWKTAVLILVERFPHLQRLGWSRIPENMGHSFLLWRWPLKQNKQTNNKTWKIC